MGKNRVIKSMGKIIGNITVHKIVAKYTNIPDSPGHLSSEVVEYRDNALKISKEFNWNSQDKEEIKSEAIRNFQNKMKVKYSDVNFPEEEAEKLLEETIKECGL